MTPRLDPRLVCMRYGMSYFKMTDVLPLEENGRFVALDHSLNDPVGPSVKDLEDALAEDEAFRAINASTVKDTEQ